MVESPPTKPRRRLPEWLKVKAPGGENYLQLRSLLRAESLNTVCEEANCPNIGECWDRGTATFMILGDVCTRACTYCAVKSGTPLAVDPAEPMRLAASVERMGLTYAVITSVDRDDLPDAGASAFAQCIKQIRDISRVILPITIKCHNPFSSCSCNPIVYSSTLPCILTVSDNPQFRLSLLFDYQNVQCIICTTVINDDDFIGELFAQSRDDLVNQR